MLVSSNLQLTWQQKLAEVGLENRLLKVLDASR